MLVTTPTLAALMSKNVIARNQAIAYYTGRLRFRAIASFFIMV